MRARITVIVVMLTSLLVVGFGMPAIAQTTTNSTTSVSERAARIEERKKLLKSALTTAETTKLQTKCVVAQGLIQRAATQTSQAVAAHTAIYDKTQTKLAALIAKLESQNFSTAELRNAKTELTAKIDAYNTDVKSYQQALSDTSVMGCASDPTGFKASLEASRTAREKVRTDAEGIQTYITKTLKPILTSIGDKLKASSSSQGA
jgi:uncharacterized coiled-coil protein SlyX